MVASCFQLHQLVQAWSQVESGLVMSGAGYIMERFQRNAGVRPGWDYIYIYIIRYITVSSGDLIGYKIEKI